MKQLPSSTWLTDRHGFFIASISFTAQITRLQKAGEMIKLLTTITNDFKHFTTPNCCCLCIWFSQIIPEYADMPCQVGFCSSDEKQSKSSHLNSLSQPSVLHMPFLICPYYFNLQTLPASICIRVKRMKVVSFSFWHQFWLLKVGCNCHMEKNKSINLM